MWGIGFSELILLLMFLAIYAGSRRLTETGRRLSETRRTARHDSPSDDDDVLLDPK